MAEWTEPDSTEGEDVPTAEVWTLFFDGSTNLKGAGADIVLQAPTRETLQYAVRLDFPATNNEAEYEGLLAGLRVAVALGVRNSWSIKCKKSTGPRIRP